MRTRAAELDLLNNELEPLLYQGLPMRTTKRRRNGNGNGEARAATTTTPTPTTNDDGGSCGHTTDDGSVASSSSSASASSGSSSAVARPASPLATTAETEEQPQQQQQRRKQRGKVALVLGMIRMSDAFMETYHGPADPLLDLHAARDTRRIWVLEKELKTDVLSLGDARRMPRVDHAEDGGKHVSCLFESPDLRGLQRALNGRKIGHLLGDYIRFPPDYLRKCYTPVVKVLIPALLRSGLLADDCQVYLPYLRQHKDVRNIYEEMERAFHPGRAGSPGLVRPNDNPLYRATRRLFKEEHMHKTEGLAQDTPFLRCALGSSVKNSWALRAPWW